MVKGGGRGAAGKGGHSRRDPDEPERLPVHLRTLGDRTSHIKNKLKRSEVYNKLKHEKKVAKSKGRRKRQDERQK